MVIIFFCMAYIILICNKNIINTIKGEKKYD
nr:MAG TPA: hypothetical protein [Caudoviricetes sp.]